MIMKIRKENKNKVLFYLKYKIKKKFFHIMELSSSYFFFYYLNKV